MYLKKAVALIIALIVSICKGEEELNGNSDWGMPISYNDDTSSDVLNRSLNSGHGSVLKTFEDREHKMSRLSDDLRDVQLKVDSRAGKNKQNPCKVVKDESKYLTTDCRGASESNIYTIRPRGANATSFRAFCLKDDSGDPWTVIQRRFDGSVNFYVDWNKYKIGFGNLSGEFWLGLDHIYTLTNSDRYELRIKLKIFNDTIYVAYYDNFLVSDEKSNYALKSVGTHSGNLTDDLSKNVETMWSTFHRDNDEWYTHCAEDFESAWWFSDCGRSDLNAPFKPIRQNDWAREERHGLTWESFDNNTIKATEMSIRIKKLP